MKRMNRSAAALASAAALVFACTQDSDDTNPTTTDRAPATPPPRNDAPSTPTPPPAAARGEHVLRLSFTALPPLAGGFTYEGWAIVGGAPVSTGKLAERVPGTETFMVTNDVAERASGVVITIEPANDFDPGPSMTKVLAGPLVNGRAELSIAAKEAIGTDFGTATGTFILATPTDGMMNNERSGVWFLVPPPMVMGMPQGMPRPSLELAPLPEGWTYEGWAVVDGTPLTTGKFVMAMGADRAAPFSASSAPAPPFPGEDFLVNAPEGVMFPRDLRNQRIVITVEPEPDDSPMPYPLTPLAARVPENAMDHTSLPLMNASSDRPRGLAEIVETR
jgi:hypothetical protein